MPTPLPVINLAAATVGSTGIIDLSNCAPSANPAYINLPATLQLYNESGAGLRLQGRDTGVAFDLPAGGWKDAQIPQGETAITYTVLYMMSNAAVTSLIATYFQPNEPAASTALGNSPVNISGGNLSTAQFLVNAGLPYGTTGIINISSTPVIGWLGGAVQFMTSDNGTDFVIRSPAASTTVSEKNFEVTAGTTIAHGQVLLDAGKIRSDGTGGLQVSKTNVLQTGNQEVGRCGGNDVASAGGQAFGPVVNFKQVMTNAPSSITFSGLNTTNANAPSGNLIDLNGFNLFWTSVAGGATAQIGTYTTVGN